MTVDGFSIENSFNFMPNDTSLNAWSHGKTTTVIVYDSPLRPRTIEWRGKSRRVLDYGMFTGMIKQWVNSKDYPMSKDAALDLYFSMGV